MKANELMVGDFVLSKSDDKIYKINSIITQDDGSILIATEDGLQFDYMCDAIPITAEILEKNGFEKQNDGWYKITLEEENLIGIQPFENVNWIFGANVFPNIIEHLNILYVHELQHALRLCGIEKEIIL